MVLQTSDGTGTKKAVGGVRAPKAEFVGNWTSTTFNVDVQDARRALPGAEAVNAVLDNTVDQCHRFCPNLSRLLYA